MEQLWDTSDVAAYFKLRTPETVRDWVKAGKLALFCRLPGGAMRFRREDVVKLGPPGEKPKPEKRTDHTAADAQAAFLRAMEAAKKPPRRGA